MKKKSNINSVLEIFWLIVCIATLLIGLYSVITDGLKDSYMFFIMSGLAFALYLARRGLRRKDALNQD